MNNIFEKLEKMDCLITKMEREATYKKHGIEGVYKATVRPKTEAKRIIKKDMGKKFNETEFEISYTHTKIEVVSDLLYCKLIRNSEKDRKVIANELKNLANELESIK